MFCVLGVATPRPTPHCNVTNMKENHNERCKFLQELYSNIKEIYSALGNTCQFIVFEVCLQWEINVFMASLTPHPGNPLS